jgi:hypothetical protein
MASYNPLGDLYVDPPALPNTIDDPVDLLATLPGEGTKCACGILNLPLK